MRVPLGVVMTLRHEDDIQLCENCERYLYLVETTEAVDAPGKKHAKRGATSRLIPA